MGIPPEEYWIRSGAKPKFTSQIPASLLPPARSKEQGTTYLLSMFLCLRNIQKDLMQNRKLMVFEQGLRIKLMLITLILMKYLSVHLGVYLYPSQTETYE